MAMVWKYLPLTILIATVCMAADDVKPKGGAHDAVSRSGNHRPEEAVKALSKTVKFKFTGAVTQIVDPAHLVGNRIVVGDSLSGIFSYPTDVPNHCDSQRGTGCYEFHEPPFEFTITVQTATGELSFSHDFALPLSPNIPNIPRITVTNDGRVLDSVWDNFQVYAPVSPRTWPLPFLAPLIGIQVQLTDYGSPPTLLGSPALPTCLDISETTDSYAPALRSNSQLFSWGTAGDEEIVYGISFNVTSLTPACH